MTFDYPIVLTGFLIFIPLFIFDLINRKKRRNLSADLEKKIRASGFLFCLFLTFTIISLAGPRWGVGYAPSEFRRGLDTVFAIDISRSMDIRDAQDVNTQSRLERGLLISRQAITSVNGARFAAAVGRSMGYLAVPLTYDNEAVLIFLEAIDGSSITGRSTNLETLIEAAISAFQSSSAARKIIVLVSDGEAHAGALRNALNRCIREGIIVTTVAVGSDEGRQILSNANDPHSQPVISRRDAVVMRSAAERTGGIYIDGSREDAAFTLSSHLLSLAQETEFSQITAENRKKEPKQRRTLFILLALISFAASKFITRTIKANNYRLPLVLLQVITLFPALFIFTSCSEGKLLLLEANYLNSRGRYEEAITQYQKALNYEDAAAYAEYGLGLAFYSLDEAEMALSRYDNSKKLLKTFSNKEHRELRFRNHYNSGIVLFEEGDYNSAAAAFREALKEDPRKIDAKLNLELSLMAISMETNTQSSSNNRQEQKEILFDYLRQEEEQKWRSREWAPEENYSGPDY